VQNLFLSVCCPLALCAFLAMPGVFHPDRRPWIYACIASFVGFGVLVAVRRRVGRVLTLVRCVEALVMVALIGTSTDRLGILICCAMTTILVLVAAATQLCSAEVAALTVLGVTSDAVLLAGHGQRGAELAVGSMTAGVLSGVPAIVLLAFRMRLQSAARIAHELARTDPLTGLLNRHGLALDLTMLVTAARAGRQLVGVLLIDLDHFKLVNDRYGHLAGDEVLRRVSAVLNTASRRGDLVARLGGEEICVVMRCSAAAELPAAGERLRRAVEGLECVPAVTVSVGGVCAPVPDDEDPEEFVMRLVGLADQPLYEVKASGRNGVQVLVA
jgi:diguanylate cyclase (GGDEF)-like protein